MEHKDRTETARRVSYEVVQHRKANLHPICDLIWYLLIPTFHSNILLIDEDLHHPMPCRVAYAVRVPYAM